MIKNSQTNNGSLRHGAANWATVLGSSVVLGEGFEQLHVEIEAQHGVVCWLKKMKLGSACEFCLFFFWANRSLPPERE